MEKDNNKYFTQALSRFVKEVASDGAIRHLADLGYTPTQIYRKLEYPTSMEHIGKVMWEHFTNQGIIVYDNPDENACTEEVRYVKENGTYGRTTFRRVVEKVERPKREYVLVDFGKRMYQDRTGFEKCLECLSEDDRDYVLGLPWELKPVYHVADERMMRIAEITNDKKT